MSTQPKERPILFNDAMVRAILDGRKTQTRRIMKGAALDWIRLPGGGFSSQFIADAENRLCPFGHPGDRLWVREAWQHIDGGAVHDAAGGVMDSHDPETIYRASRPNYPGPWKASIHMPRWASRITLEITCVRVERLNDISGADAVAEGVRSRLPDNGIAVSEYRDLWESINGPGSWNENPWVWVIEFKMVEGAA